MSLNLGELDSRFDPLSNLRNLARGVYTTGDEKFAAKRVLEDHLGVKVVFTLSLAVTCVALGIILGPSVFADAVTVAAIVPLGMCLASIVMHNDIKKMHERERATCLKIIQDISDYLDDLREQKIAYVFECKHYNLHKMEESFETEHDYVEKVNLANRAMRTIERHPEIYSWEKAEMKQFEKVHAVFCGTNLRTPRTVILEQTDVYPSKLVKKTVNYHPTHSVIAEES